MWTCQTTAHISPLHQTLSDEFVPRKINCASECCWCLAFTLHGRVLACICRKKNISHYVLFKFYTSSHLEIGGFADFLIRRKEKTSVRCGYGGTGLWVGWPLSPSSCLWHSWIGLSMHSTGLDSMRRDNSRLACLMFIEDGFIQSGTVWNGRGSAPPGSRWSECHLVLPLEITDRTFNLAGLTQVCNNIMDPIDK